MKIPYVPDPPIADSPEDDAIIKRIRARRGSGGLLKLDLALLHSPPLADGWNSFFGAIRTRTSISGDLRELIMCRIAVCNEAWYEWDQHAPLAEHEGVGRAALEAIKKDPLDDKPSELTEKQWAVVLYTDEMTKNIRVKDATMQKLRDHFSDREVVEVTTTVKPSQPILVCRIKAQNM